MTFPVLLTRLMPPEVLVSSISRPRLIERLNEACQHALVLVSAPAGFGKTTFLAAWTRQMGQDSAWLTLEPGDNEAHRFFAYLVAALDRVLPGLLENMHSALQATPDQAEMLLTTLLNRLVNLKKDLYLVLDDYHVIENVKIHQYMMFFLEHLPARMHVILSTRSDPPLQLSRLRGRGAIREIRSGELRFNAAECFEFLNVQVGLRLTAEQVKALEKRTEGWAAGLYLVTLSLQRLRDGQEGDFIANLSSNNHYVLDYLTDEVLSRLDEDLHGFLLETSILEQLSAPLCTAVTGRHDCAQLLERLESENLFLFALDEDHRWYRYHPLFADLLQRRLVSHSPNTAARLHLRASTWMEANNMLNEAVGHALAGGDLKQASTLIERHILETLFRGEFAAARSWLEKLPQPVVQSHPLFQLAWAWTHILPGEWEQVEEQLEQMRARLAELERDPGLAAGEPAFRQDSLASYLLVLQALVARGRGDATQVQLELIQSALRQAPEEDLRLRSMLELRLGTCYLDFGAEAEAQESFQKAEQTGWRTGSINNAVQAVYTQAVLLRRRGELGETIETCKQGIQAAERAYKLSNSQVPGSSILQIMQGTVQVEENVLTEAEILLSEGLQYLEPISQYWEVELQVKGYFALARLNLANRAKLPLPNLVRLAWLAKPILYRFAGALQARLNLIVVQQNAGYSSLPAEIVRWAAGVVLNQPDDMLFDWLVYEQLARIRVNAAASQGQTGVDLEQDLKVLEQYTRRVDANGWVDLGIEARLAGMQVLVALQREEAALEMLRQALELGERRGYLRIYLEEGPIVLPYLYRLSAAGILPGFCGRLLAVAGEEEETHPAQQGVLVEPLTAREIEILGALARGLSNQEIAQQMFISLGTVKRHTANINRKLDVHSRLQAVRRGRSLGILD